MQKWAQSILSLIWLKLGAQHQSSIVWKKMWIVVESDKLVIFLNGPMLCVVCVLRMEGHQAPSKGQVATKTAFNHTANITYDKNI